MSPVLPHQDTLKAEASSRLGSGPVRYQEVSHSRISCVPHISVETRMEVWLGRVLSRRSSFLEGGPVRDS